MKKLAIAALALGLAACSSSSTTTENVTSCQPKIYDPTLPVAQRQPACTTAVNFTVDDSVNQVYSTSVWYNNTSSTDHVMRSDLQWKGSFVYDPHTRMAYLDSGWGLGLPAALVQLYDDGAWDATTSPGHEPHGAAAGDHRWGATIFVPNPAAAQTWNYGLVDAAFNYGWIWAGANAGSFTVPAGGSATAITATGQTFAAFGTNDVMLTLDIANMNPAYLASTTDRTQPKVKGSAWGWNLIPMYDDGTHGDATASDGIWTFRLSDWMGAGKTYFHSGLANSGQQIQFVFTVGATDKEYKQNGVPPTAGVTGYVKPAAGSFTGVTVANLPTGDQNTYIAVP
jgi:hypothetical protein